MAILTVDGYFIRGSTLGPNVLAIQMAGNLVTEHSGGKDEEVAVLLFNSNPSLLWNGLGLPTRCTCWVGFAWVAQGCPNGPSDENLIELPSRDTTRIFSL